MARTNDSLASRMATAQETAMKGALLFAVGNSDIDYVDLARWSRDRIQRHLELPVAVVTDRDVPDSEFDRVIRIESPHDGTQRWFDDLAKTTPWNNLDRHRAYDLTPWQHTLLLDADYVVNSDFLQQIMAVEVDFQCYRHSAAVGGEPLQHSFGDHGFPMWWATVIAFRRSERAQRIFEIMCMVKNNWRHYRNVYAIKDHLFRNDIALSIALGLVSGHTLCVDAIPGTLLATQPDQQLQLKGQSHWQVTWKRSDQRRVRCVIQDADFHAMGKHQLLEIIRD